MNFPVLIGGIIGMSLAIYTALWWRLRYRFKSGTALPKEYWPRVSIIIPCRNEVPNLPAC